MFCATNCRDETDKTGQLALVGERTFYRRWGNTLKKKYILKTKKKIQTQTPQTLN